MASWYDVRMDEGVHSAGGRPWMGKMGEQRGEIGAEDWTARAEARERRNWSA